MTEIIDCNSGLASQLLESDVAVQVRNLFQYNYHSKGHIEILKV